MSSQLINTTSHNEFNPFLISTSSTPRPKSSGSSSTHWFWGLGPSLAKVKEEISTAVHTGINVLIIGETGTGKELVAQRIFQQRKKVLALNDIEARFIPINCGAIPEGLAESLLFGHERGAFTSAREKQIGKFEMAGHGVLYLDEIQTLPMSVQVKLLRTIQHKEIDRLGSKQSAVLDCQIIAASNVPLEFLVEKNTFRKDLYYRLNVCPIYIPALRNRKEDLPVLIRGLLEQIRKKHQLRATTVNEDVFALFLDYRWPGNIRELEHVLLFAALRSGKTIQPEHLPSYITGHLKEFLNCGDWAL